MADVRDYVRWRGDLRFSQDPFHPVDALVLCALSYIHFDDGLQTEQAPRTLCQIGQAFLEQDIQPQQIRSKNDPELLKLASESQRFGTLKVSHYEDVLLRDQDTQFAAMTFLLDDGTAAVVFRGTDSSVVGWKEDFNMSFQQTVPAQRMALDYLRRVAAEYPGPLRICGHSKGGNMAVFAAARCGPLLQERIVEVFNNDGPGFTDYMMGDPGYKVMVPRIHTFVPQSSIIGMLMDHEEPYTIIKSRQIGLLQHDVYNWEILGPRFIPMEEITADSRFLNQTIRNWAASMDNQQRNQVVDAVFDMLEQGRVEDAGDIFSPRNVKNYLKILSANEEMRKIIGGEFVGFLEAAGKTMNQISLQKELEEPRERRRSQRLLKLQKERAGK